jgi:hypothetical protein
VSYAADKNGTLPGPSLAHNYNKANQYGSTGMLPWILRDYLPLVTQVSQPVNPAPYYSPTFDYPAARTDGKNPISVSKPTYSVYINQQDASGWFKPLGYHGDTPKTPPMTMPQLAARDTRGKGWITESLLINPPPHVKFRNTLMFDYSVRAIPAQ